MTDGDLARFVTAQDEDGIWQRALAEIRAGRKESHWMWFVLPQHVALGHSPTAKLYGISGVDEARAYLAHPVLGPRLLRTAQAVLASDTDPQVVFGPVDAAKLRSSMTLFAAADPGEPVFAAVLQKFYDGEPDPATLELL